MQSDNFFYTSYLEMFEKLDKCWELTRDEGLGALLGSMNPHIFSDKKPIDSSMYKDWVSICETKNEEPNNINNIAAYLRMQETKFNINLSHVINLLHSTDID